MTQRQLPDARCQMPVNGHGCGYDNGNGDNSHSNDNNGTA
jgi:hypothetical protein